jgi:hypothetical protein
VLGKKVTGWQVLPADAQEIEEAVLHTCDLVLAGDPRIGKAPGKRRASRSATKEGNKILEAGEGSQETSESSEDAVTSGVQTSPSFCHPTCPPSTLSITGKPYLTD